jgi:hypothetical protein
MNSSKNLAAVVTLAVAAGLAGTGCMAQSEAADETKGQDEMAAAPAEQTAGADHEKTGEAAEKCGFGGCGFCGFGCPFPINGFGCPSPIGGLAGFGCWGSSFGCW